ncbi:MAG: proton-conducting transporter membrane subunit [Elusimicrobiales bacterium]
MTLMLLAIFLPLAAAPLAMSFAGKLRRVGDAVAILVSLVCLVASVLLFGKDMLYTLPWAGFGFDFSMRIYPLASLALCAVNGFALLVSRYSWKFMEDKPARDWYYFSFLITLGFANGAILAENLVLMLFFWEGLLVTLYLFLALARENNECKATAMKALIINGAGDVCLMAGVVITGWLAGTMSMKSVAAAPLAIHGWGMAGFIFMALGAMAKAGALPFHTWIPDAASDAQLPFMAYLPAALEKVLGIYLLAKVCLEFYALNSSLSMRLALMTLGAATILIAVMMALVQSEYKRLLSYHAISQVGYMILGIGTGNPVGVAGGLFHMVNHAVYKCCLFLTGGSVENRAGVTKLDELGGLAKTMPVTAACFVVAAAAISGIPPFNGYFSKELIYKGALDTGYTGFFIAAELGSLLTLASFLKLGHSVYFGKKPEGLNVKEASWHMLGPMLVLAGICVIFGFGAKLPLKFLIEPSLAGTYADASLASLYGFSVPEHLHGFHADKLFFMALGVIALASLNHWFGLRRGGSPQKASEHVHHAPGLGFVYSLAEKRFFDPYDQGMKLTFFLGRGLYVLDRVMDFFTDTLPAALTDFASLLVSRLHGGFFGYYLGWAVAGFVLFALIISYTGALP